MTAVDLHQHLWPEAVLPLLERRAEPPRARWAGAAWRVELPGEPAFLVHPAQHDPGARAAALPGAGVERAVLALSAPVGVERLPAGEAVAGVEAWGRAGAALPAELGWWAAVPAGLPLDEQTSILSGALDQGAAGLCLDATRVDSTAAAADALALLAHAEHASVPVFVHPGPVTGGPAYPGWWSPATAYVAQMHAAWHALGAVARPALPGLRLVYALLAGLAPLHAERTALRGGPALDAPDPLTFYDTSSYGPRALRAMAEAVGTAQLVHGSDAPVAVAPGDPVAAALGPVAAATVRREAPARALRGEAVPA